jgi:hypothetical protein
LVVAARRVKLVDIADFIPQQSDYASRWAEYDGNSTATTHHRASSGAFKQFVWKASPRLVRRVYEELRRSRDEKFGSAAFIRVPTTSLVEHIH